MNAARRSVSMRMGAWLCAGVIGVGTQAAHASVLVFEFEGVVSHLTGNTGVFGHPSLVQVGDPFTGRFAYEVGPGNPDQAPAEPAHGVYTLLQFQIDQAVVPITPYALSITHEPGLLTLFPDPPDPGIDGVSVIGTYPAGDVDRLVSLRLRAPYNTVFTDVSLPTHLALDDFTTQQQVIAIVVLALIEHGGESQLDVGQLTLLVPEPTSVAILGVAALLLFRRRTVEDRGDPQQPGS